MSTPKRVAEKLREQLRDADTKYDRLKHEFWLLSDAYQSLMGAGEGGQLMGSPDEAEKRYPEDYQTIGGNATRRRAFREGAEWARKEAFREAAEAIEWRFNFNQAALLRAVHDYAASGALADGDN